MTLEKKVTSLDLSKRLKELGVKQESLFYWSFYKDQSQVLYPQQEVFKESWKLDPNYCSAFTVAELGEMLPDKIRPENQWDHYILYSMKNTSDGEWVVRYEINKTVWCATAGDTETNARAKMLIYLLENKLITL